MSPETPHPTPHTPHPTPYTLHPTPYTPHPTPHTPHPSQKPTAPIAPIQQHHQPELPLIFSALPRW
ncbi:MAG: hypothetical protein F6J93_12790 [Oscillatoria sp. SIO1A7]|nr:hypothetical protein [Oscillatoria sp. SIO1A7]